LYVAGIEEALKSRSFGLQLANDFDDAVVNHLKTIDEGIGWLQPDRRRSGQSNILRHRCR